MSHYRKIDPRIWNDEKFRTLSDNGKLVFFMLLTHPHMTALGAMRATIPGLACELGWTTKAFAEAFGEALSKAMVKHDAEASLIALPSFLKYNPPESPNVVKAWQWGYDSLPECPLKAHIIQEAKAFTEGLTEAFAKAFDKAFPKAIGNQEQEQKQEQEQIHTPPKPKAARRAKKPATAMPEDFGISDAVRAWAAKKGIGNLEAHLEAFRLQAAAKGYTYADWDAALQNAIRGNWAGIKPAQAQRDEFRGVL